MSVFVQSEPTHKVNIWMWRENDKWLLHILNKMSIDKKSHLAEFHLQNVMEAMEERTAETQQTNQLSTCDFLLAKRIFRQIPSQKKH